jgi:predicted transcriptional regulator YheO
MMKKNVPSKADRLILEAHKVSAEALSVFLGDAFEIVLHDLNDLDHSVISIFNGYHSGRKEGAPITDLALSMVEEINKNKANSYKTYYSQSKYGKPVKSVTTAIFGEKNQVIGLLCINLYLDSPLTAILDSFTLESRANYLSEHFITESDELINRALKKVKDEVETDDSVSASQKNREIITLLYHQGVFKLKNAVKMISGDLDISKNTVYLHLRTLEDQQ